jgi:hypothetical protein
MRVRRSLDITAKAYGYRGRESADYLKKTRRRYPGICGESIPALM